MRGARPRLHDLVSHAVEKNIDEFLALDLPGTKVVIGDGPDRKALEARYPETTFLGYKFGAELALCLSAADVFVFPSRTDTFGLVMLEAMARGTPVAAYPVIGPIDIVTPGMTGVLDADLRKAALGALAIDRDRCARLAAGCTWERASRQFLGHLVRAADGTDLVTSASPAASAPGTRGRCSSHARVAAAT